MQRKDNIEKKSKKMVINRKTLYYLLTIGIVITLSLWFWIFPNPAPIENKKAYIAVVGPMSIPKGREMLNGINLYVDKINAAGGINGRKLKTIKYDDENNPEIAAKIADQLASENKVLVVLGHYYSSTSAVAGKIYRKEEIPAITASASAESVTMGNEWYFRTIPDDIMQGGFIANYINRSLKKNYASIVVTNDQGGLALKRAFEKAAAKLGMEIKHTWSWRETANAEEQLETIVDEIQKAEDPGILFFATHAAEGAKILTNLVDRGVDRTIIGSAAFARSLMDAMKKYPREQEEPGYYTDGIFFATPFLFDIANLNSYRYEYEYRKKYSSNPTWITAAYYDATAVAVEAMKKAGIRGLEHVRADRRKIKDVLKSFYSQENAVKGITGDIYFHEDGGVKRPYAIGVFQKHQEIPAFLQYAELSGLEHIERASLAQRIMEGEIIVISGIFMNSIRVVYTGIEVVDLEHSIKNPLLWNLEFDLLFRYFGDFVHPDTGVEIDAYVEFENTVGPVKIDHVETKVKNNITKRKYRVKATFHCDFNFRDYPFDRQVIPIRFRHKEQTNDKLVYVRDIQVGPKSYTRKVHGWKIDPMRYYQDLDVKSAGLGHPKIFGSSNILSYSRFNAGIPIERDDPGLIWGRYLIPIFSMLVFLYLIFWLKPGILSLRILMIIIVWVICGFCYLMFLYHLNASYLTLLDYLIFLVLVLVLISALATMAIHRLHLKGKHIAAKFINNMGKIIFPVIPVLLGLFIYFRIEGY
jgi:branched-chain amino acid transport system substrate-binding protein